jgi:hypothetical protein
MDAVVSAAAVRTLATDDEMRAYLPGSDARLQSDRRKSTGSSRGMPAVGEEGEDAIPRGFWESAPLTVCAEAVSIVMRRSGRRTVVTGISTPVPI